MPVSVITDRFYARNQLTSKPLRAVVDKIDMQLKLWGGMRWLPCIVWVGLASGHDAFSAWLEPKGFGLIPEPTHRSQRPR